MNKLDKAILVVSFISIVLSIWFGIGYVIEIDEQRTTISKQKKQITELKAKNEQLKEDKEGLYNKYYYEKMQAEYWYYSCVNDAY